MFPAPMNRQVRYVDLFKSFQGEGTYLGIPAVFLRLADCNLDCNFCDTDFASYAKESSTFGISEEIAEILKRNPGCYLVCITGGEPLLQKDAVFDIALRIRQRFPGVILTAETNGTVDILDIKDDIIDAANIEFSCSPKFRQAVHLNARTVDVKVVMDPAIPDPLRELQRVRQHFTFNASKNDKVTTFWVQPCASGDLLNPVDMRWLEAAEQEGYRIGVQAHKMWGLK